MSLPIKLNETQIRQQIEQIQQEINRIQNIQQTILFYQPQLSNYRKRKYNEI